jgi:hypothetical protein
MADMQRAVALYSKVTNCGLQVEARVPVTNILKLFSKFKALDFNHLSMAQYFI